MSLRPGILFHLNIQSPLVAYLKLNFRVPGYLHSNLFHPCLLEKWLILFLCKKTRQIKVEDLKAEVNCCSIVI